MQVPKIRMVFDLMRNQVKIPIKEKKKVSLSGIRTRRFKKESAGHLCVVQKRVGTYKIRFECMTVSFTSAIL